MHKQLDRFVRIVNRLSNVFFVTVNRIHQSALHECTQNTQSAVGVADKSADSIIRCPLHSAHHRGADPAAHHVPSPECADVSKEHEPQVAEQKQEQQAEMDVDVEAQAVPSADLSELAPTTHVAQPPESKVQEVTPPDIPASAAQFQFGCQVMSDGGSEPAARAQQEAGLRGGRPEALLAAPAQAAQPPVRVAAHPRLRGAGDTDSDGDSDADSDATSSSESSLPELQAQTQTMRLKPTSTRDGYPLDSHEMEPQDGSARQSCRPSKTSTRRCCRTCTSRGRRGGGVGDVDQVAAH